MRNDLRVHVVLANPAGDELGVLSAEVDHENGAAAHETIVVSNDIGPPVRWMGATTADVSR